MPGGYAASQAQRRSSGRIEFRPDFSAMRLTSLFGTALCAALFAAGCAPLTPTDGESPSDAGPAPGAGAPYVLPRSEVRTMRSRTGADYRILVARPAAPPPPAGYPVLYLLDGDDGFAIAAVTAERLGRHAARSGVVPGLIVGISYPGASRRSLDYTPAGTDPAAGPGGRVDATGGAQAFRDFIANELQPAIARDFPIDASRQALMGHSYGGLFVLDTLFRRPDLFRTYIASSPSIWFAQRRVLEQESAFVERQRAASRKLDLVLTVGELEQPAPRASAGPTGEAGNAARLTERRMVDDSRALAERLGALKDTGLTVHYRVLAGETHGSSPLPAIGGALPHAFGR